MVFVELHVPDFEKAISFYSLFGFSVFEKDPSYRVLKLGKNVINLYLATEHSYFDYSLKRGVGVEIIIFVDDVDRVYNVVKDKVKVISELDYKKWGARDFRVEDPFGYYLRISSPYPSFS